MSQKVHLERLVPAPREAVFEAWTEALDEAGVDYDVVLHPAFPRGRRQDYIELSGQKLLPAIEFEDGTVLRDESKRLAARIREGRMSSG
ncbi:MAG: hypothetical protein M3025_02485 [Actinomycetota bacterium]|nr:hypothetical protein [Actinomycetota bacterium]